MKLALVAVACAACSTTADNLGNHVFGEPRWSISIGSSGSEHASAAVVDHSGNVIVGGTCDGVVDFGSGPIECRGAFITQRSSETGAEMWTATIDDARVTQLAVINGGLRAVATRPVLDGGIEEFVVDFDTRGTMLAVKDLGLTGVVSPVATIDRDGRVLTTGGSTDAHDTLDVHLSIHDALGELAWTRVLSGDGRQVGSRITVGPEHDITLVVDTVGPFRVGDTFVDVGPGQVIVQLTPGGDLAWAQPMVDGVHQVAVAPDLAVVAVGCPSTSVLDWAGDLAWKVRCKDLVATVDSLAISDDGLIVSGGHHADASGEDGELFLTAFDRDGNLVASARTFPHAEPSDSRIDAIAVEPTGEVVFAITATHAFDIGNGLLPYAGEEDVVVAKLDSSTGRDGQVLLARTVP